MRKDICYACAGIEVNAAREKLCLREVIRRYGKIVERWEQLDPLPFDDPQLEEASKAYLYGFYRASVVLSSSAVEKRLKRVANVDYFEHYEDLVEAAASCSAMSPVWKEQALLVFRTRTKVVHRDHAPSHDQAGEVLSNARDVLTKVLS